MPDAPVSSGPLHVHFGEFEVDESNALLLRNGSPIALAPTPFGLLCALLRQPGTLLSKHALLDEVWGHRFVSDSVLKGTISDVRRVLGDEPRQPRYIQTVSRRGYRLIAAPVPVGGAAVTVGRGPVAAQPPATSPGAFEAEREPASPFVGRAAELARLHHRWNHALRGSRAIVWPAGGTGHRQDDLDRAFRGRSRWRRLHARPVRAAPRDG